MNWLNNATKFGLLFCLCLGGCDDAPSSNGKSRQVDFIYLTSWMEPRRVTSVQNVPKYQKEAIGVISSSDELPSNPEKQIQLFAGRISDSEIETENISWRQFQKRSEMLNRARWIGQLVVFKATEMTSLHPDSRRQRRLEKTQQLFNDIVSRETSSLSE